MTEFSFDTQSTIAQRSASAPPALSRRGVGSAVFGGMRAASALGIFVIPALYVVVQRLRERLKGHAASPTQEGETPEVSVAAK